MGTIVKSKTFIDNEILLYTDLNTLMDTIYNEFNGSISNANISGSAAIAASKISGTAVTLAGAETLTNKTLTSPDIGGSMTLSQSWDGWIMATDTWTYASASTFTIAGVDRTAILSKGTKLKFTQTTTKYAVVASSSFSTNTTVTIIVNTDYTIANATITLPNYSYVSPPDFPSDFEFTPTSNGFSVAPTGQKGFYSTQGREITVIYFENAVGTSNATYYTKNLPVNVTTMASGVASVGNAHGCVDNGVYLTSETTVLAGSTDSALSLYKTGGSVSWTNSGYKGCTNLMITYIF